jgi:hypothetical protein
MVFKPGQSGNADGGKLAKQRKKALINELLGLHVNKAVAVIAKHLDSDDPAWAAKLVLEYCYGKPAQSLELSGPEGGPIGIVSDTPLSIEQFAAKFAPKADGE